MAGRDPAGSGLASSAYVFPLVEGTPVLALAFSVGTIIWFDLRLLGVWMRHQPVSRVFGSLKLWMLGGFAVMFVTGALLFTSLATSAPYTPTSKSKSCCWYWQD